MSIENLSSHMFGLGKKHNEPQLVRGLRFYLESDKKMKKEGKKK